MPAGNMPQFNEQSAIRQERFVIPVDVIFESGRRAKELNEEQKIGIRDRITHGDWGDVSEEVTASNAQSLKIPEDQEKLLIGQYEVGDLNYQVKVFVKDGKAEALYIGVLKRFDIPENAITLSGSLSKKIAAYDSSKMLERFADGDWGDVSDFVREANNQECAKGMASGTEEAGFITGQYKVRGVDYRINAEVANGQVTKLEIISVKEDAKRLLGGVDLSGKPQVAGSASLEYE